MVDARIPCMATAFDDTGQHPVTSTIAAISQLLHEVADLGLWTLPAAETEANLTALAQLRHQITELELRHAQPRRPPRPRRRGRCRRHGSYWANPTRQTKRDAKRRLDLATPWTTTTSRSGTRWPPARCPRNRRW